MHNNALKPLSTTNKIFTFDPTAHGERQLVSWYYANKTSLSLPEPKELTEQLSLLETKQLKLLHWRYL
jgi:cytosine deaminase